MAEPRDFYDVLGVDRNASADEIQRAYRKLARQYHPDVNKDPGAEGRFHEIGEAYDVLSNPDTRSRYDAFGHDFRRVPEDVTPEQWRRARAGATAGARSRARGRGDGGDDSGFGFDTSGFDGGVDFEDLFGDMFGGRFRRGGRAGWGPIVGADQEAVLTLTVEEAYRGGRRTITVGGRTLEVDIPPGVTDGQRIRLAGQGGHGSGGAEAGDLYLVVRLAPHPRYRVDGRDITVDLPLAPWEAALGTTVAIDTPGGEAKVTVPPATSTGKRLRLRGRGMPNPRGTPGDLYAEVKVVVPPRLTDEERHLFEELARVSDFDPGRTR
jgi:curved DNA-binding protein